MKLLKIFHNTALHIAVLNRNKDMISLLLKDSRINQEIKDEIKYNI